MWHLFTQVCHGLKKLHDSGVVHRALKSRNLLLFPEELYDHPYLKYRCKLTDLSISELQRRLRLGDLDGSTLRYLAPEVLSGQQVITRRLGGSSHPRLYVARTGRPCADPLCARLPSRLPSRLCVYAARRREGRRVVPRLRTV